MLFVGLSITITQAVFPLIPRLYNLFVYFANFRFLKNEFIYNVWNNLYVLVGVVVLFAIAIKLISAMVNPDTLGDNKKGAKGAYFRAIIAVILIFACPIMFNIAYDIQDSLFSNNFLMSRIFGYSIDDQAAGQMLAWETFSSFCTPVDPTKKTPVTMEDATDSKYMEYYRLMGDIDYIYDLDTEMFFSTGLGGSTDLNIGTLIDPINSATNSIVNATATFEYHSILCPLAGILVAYELLLLCMDTIFRSAKIAVLQLMLPLVLGAYVFNPDILKKWAKEFFSTFITVFLKVSAIGFMIIAINELKGVLF